MLRLVAWLSSDSYWFPFKILACWQFSWFVKWLLWPAYFPAFSSWLCPFYPKLSRVKGRHALLFYLFLLTRSKVKFNLMVNEGFLKSEGSRTLIFFCALGGFIFITMFLSIKGGCLCLVCLENVQNNCLFCQFFLSSKKNITAMVWQRRVRGGRKGVSVRYYSNYIAWATAKDLACPVDFDFTYQQYDINFILWL